MTRRERSGGILVRRLERDSLFTLNAGRLGAISCGQRELERELRAAKYGTGGSGTEGSGAYCARGRPFVSQRAPPRAPALAAHDQRLLQEDQSRSAENLPSCVRDVVGKIDECTRRTAPKARWSLLRCGTSARNSLLPHRGGGREDKARGRTPDAHAKREGPSLGVQGPQGAERQQLVLVGAPVPSASEEKGDTSGRLMDTDDRGRPTGAPKLPA